MQGRVTQEPEFSSFQTRRRLALRFRILLSYMRAVLRNETECVFLPCYDILFM